MVVGTKSTAVLPAEVTISAHAVDRYIERWAPHLAGQPERASQELAALLAKARRVRVYPDGDEMWRTPKPKNIRLIVGYAHCDQPTLVTVYPPYGGAQHGRSSSPLPESAPVPAPVPKPVGPLRLADGAPACRVCQTPLTQQRQKSTCGRPECRREHAATLRRWRRRYEPGFTEKVTGYQAARRKRLAADPEALAAWKARRVERDRERNARRRERERQRAEQDPVFAAELRAQRAASFARWISQDDRRDAVRTRNRERMRLARAERMAEGKPTRPLRRGTTEATPPARLPPAAEEALRRTPADGATVAALTRLLGGCLCCGAEAGAVLRTTAAPGEPRAAVDVADLPETPWPDVMPACVTCAEKWERTEMTWHDHTATVALGAEGVSASARWACERVTQGLVTLEADRLAHTRKDRDWERHPAEVWQARAPLSGPYLPGVWREIRFDPEPRTMIPLDHVVPLHGLLSTVLLPRYGHDRRKPSFSLVPWHGVPSGWSVYVDDGDVGRALSCVPTMGHIAGHPVGLAFGAQVIRPKTPRLPEPGRYRVRLVALTPIVIRTSASGKTMVSGQVRSSNLLASLTSENFCRRLRIAREDVAQAVLMRLPGHSGEMRTVHTGGHLGGKHGGVTGDVTGWVGEMVLEVNAPGLWLLRCAEFLGLGGRTAYGFGCVRLLSVERQDGPAPGG